MLVVQPTGCDLPAITTRADPKEPAMSTRGPLHDMLVVDLTRALAGPHATMMLGDLGARVVKIENPAGGDDTRGWGTTVRLSRRLGGYRAAGVDVLLVR